ncbi:hypothetical protein PV10_00633 [Exophiala mesophila]|uniref:Uncharacterized protein n=1 Tax=Exophiala mesophila TaxID=212818 RepID=A0A0D1ZQC6_EXOME|nr:uncharacterized protein PV10_00633 [Exophiala mesophila]KIV96817.1 hypothetical protein PV10_00633 [Exophiala mesophila]
MTTTLFFPLSRERQYLTETGRSSLSSPASSRRNSISSITSHKSEPAWMTSRSGEDRSRTNSVTSRSSSTSTKSTSGLSKLFGRNKGDKKKEKKDVERIVITSRHAAAVKAKLANDPHIQKVRQKAPCAPLMTGTQKSSHLTAMEQQLRHPHSGPPSVTAVRCVEADMPALARIVSGDEADEPDHWEKMRNEWRAHQSPGIEMMQVLEGEALDISSMHGSSTSTSVSEDGQEFRLVSKEVIDKDGVTVTMVTEPMSPAASLRPRPQRLHTPIGSRWRKDENGVWKR